MAHNKSIPVMLQELQERLDRNSTIYKKWVTGNFTQKELGEEYNLSSQRIGQIIKQLSNEAYHDLIKE